ncbi:MAG TPA: hypothetical protein VNL16_15750 [Chloroflexota bacterium]|nr:hypothetical protein [Chloroflexota bacterium]
MRRRGWFLSAALALVVLFALTGVAAAAGPARPGQQSRSSGHEHARSTRTDVANASQGAARTTRPIAPSKTLQPATETAPGTVVLSRADAKTRAPRGSTTAAAVGSAPASVKGRPTPDGHVGRQLTATISGAPPRTRRAAGRGRPAGGRAAPRPGRARSGSGQSATTTPRAAPDLSRVPASAAARRSSAAPLAIQPRRATMATAAPALPAARPGIAALGQLAASRAIAALELPVATRAIIVEVTAPAPLTAAMDPRGGDRPVGDAPTVPAPPAVPSAPGTAGLTTAPGGPGGAPGPLLTLATAFAFIVWRALQRQTFRMPPGIALDVLVPPG